MRINSLIKTEIGSDTQIAEKDRLLKKHDARSIIYVMWCHEDNPMHTFCSSAQWLCDDMAWRYIYYAPWFLIFGHSVCYEPISVLIYVYIYNIYVYNIYK